MKSKENKIKVKWVIIGLSLGLLLGLIALFFQKSNFLERKAKDEKIKTYCYDKVANLNKTGDEGKGIYAECLRDLGGEL